MVGRAWARFSSCKPLDTIDALNDIVLTFQYAENLENTSIVRAAGQAVARARSKFAVSRVGTTDRCVRKWYDKELQAIHMKKIKNMYTFRNP